MAELLLRYRWPLLLLGCVLGALSLVTQRGLVFDRSVENMFAESDPLLVPFRRLRRTFGSDEVVLAVYHDTRLLTPDGSGIGRLRTISSQLRNTAGVAEVLSLADLSDALADIQRMQSLLRLEKPAGEAIVAPDNPIAQRLRERFAGFTHGPDETTAAIICLLTPAMDKGDGPATTDRRRRTIDDLRAKIGRLANGVLAGEPVMVVDGFRLLEMDGRQLSWVATILMSLTMAVLFRSVRWILVLLAVVQLALGLTTATLSLLQLRLSMVSSMLSSVLTVVGVATVVHFVLDYQDQRRAGNTSQRSFQSSYRKLAAPIFWSLATDVVGFLSLIVAEVGPVRDFAVMTAVGTAYVLVSAVLVIPGLTLAGPWDRVERSGWGERQLTGQLGHSIEWIERRSTTLMVVVIALAGLAIAGTTRLQVETDFTRNFRSSSPLVTAYHQVETKLGGAGVWEILLPAPRTLTWEYLARVDQMQSRLRQLPSPDGRRSVRPPLTVLSFVDAVKAIHPRIAELPLPALRDSVVTVVGSALRAKLPGFAAALHAPDPQSGQFYYRIMLRAQERQAAGQKKQLIEQVRRVSQWEFADSEVTGYFVLLTSLIDSVLRDQWLAFALAVGGVGLLMSLVFRGVKLALVALVPNVLPILVVTGLLGWLGVRINLGAAMIAAVSMGLSIDSSIHYIAAFQRALAAGQQVPQALKSAQQGVGRALVVATLAIVIGFTSLSTSQFVPTIYFGLLASLTMLGGLTGNLLVLPLLLRWIGR